MSLTINLVKNEFWYQLNSNKIFHNAVFAALFLDACDILCLLLCGPFSWRYGLFRFRH